MQMTFCWFGDEKDAAPVLYTLPCREASEKMEGWSH